MKRQLRQKVDDNYHFLRYVKKDATAREAHKVLQLICKRYHVSRQFGIMKYHQLLRIDMCTYL